MGSNWKRDCGPGSRSAGDLLRQRREALGRDLTEIAAALRIKPAYLAALEEGRPDRLPGPAYAAGFVRAYGEHLGLDGGEILRRFRAESGALDAKPDLSFPMPLGERGIPGGSMLLAALILALCGYGAWYYLSSAERSRPERVTEVPVELLAPKTMPVTAATPRRAVQPEAAATTDQPPPAQEVGGTEPQPAAAAATLVPAVGPPAASASAASSVGNAASPPASATSPLAASAAAPATEEHGAASYGAGDGQARVLLRATGDSWIAVRGVRPSRVVHPTAESRRDLSGAGRARAIDADRQCRRSRNHRRWEVGAVDRAKWGHPPECRARPSGIVGGDRGS